MGIGVELNLLLSEIWVFAIGAVAAGAFATVILRNRPKKFWKIVDLVWISMFVATLATSATVLTERAERIEIDNVKKSLDEGYKTVLSDLQQSIIPACRNASDEWEEYCNSVQQIHENTARLEDMQVFAIAYILRDQMIQQASPSSLEETWTTLMDANDENSITTTFRAFNRQVGFPFFETNIESGAFLEPSKNSGQHITPFLPTANWSASVAPTIGVKIVWEIYYNRLSNIGEEARKKRSLRDEEAMFFMFTRKLANIWLLQSRSMYLERNASQSVLSYIQTFALLLTCYVFPFRVGKSIYEIREARQSPQPEQLRAKRRGGLNLVKYVSRYRSSRW